MSTKIIYNNSEIANFENSGKVLKCKDNAMESDVIVIDEGAPEVNMYAGSDEPSSAASGDLWIDTSDESGTIIPKTITANGTYNATADNADGYSPVTVNVPIGKAVQISNASNRRAGTSYAEISGISITVKKAGIYDVYWVGYRSATSGTFGTQLYVGSSSQGSAQTTFSNNEQHPHLSNVQLNANAILTIRGRSGSTSNYIYASNLTIIEAGD